MATVKINHKPFVASEVGLKLETIMIASAKIKDATPTVTEIDADGLSHTIVKAGAIYCDSTAGIYGIVYEDVDITGGSKEASIMTGGYFYATNLYGGTTTINAYVSGSSGDKVIDKFKAHGLYQQILGSTTAPASSFSFPDRAIPDED